MGEGTFRAQTSEKNLGPQPAVLGDFLRLAETEKAGIDEGEGSPKTLEKQAILEESSDSRDRTRTGTPVTGQGILSPQCLPFHHAADLVHLRRSTLNLVLSYPLHSLHLQTTFHP
jgi:hypothetical protein